MPSPHPKPKAKDACAPCSIATKKVESHADQIRPGRHECDLIHGDVQGLFSTGLGGARHFPSLLDDETKRSEITILKIMSEVLDFFKSYLSRNEHGENRCHRLRTDGEGECDSLAWAEF